jgi:hypothetical protein
MEPLIFKKNREATIQDRLVKLLRSKEWFVKVTHGNAFQSGLPDLYASHHLYRARWIEVKVADQFSFTRAQVIDFPRMEAAGSPIWVLTDTTDVEYAKLFKPSNLQFFMSAYLAGVTDITKWSK